MKVQDLNPDLPPASWKDYWVSLRKEKFLRFNSHHKNKSGHVFTVEIEANFFEYEGKEYSFAFIRNIQHRIDLNKKQELLQKELEERVKELKIQKQSAIDLANENGLTNFALENAIFGFYLVDENARILRANQASCEQTGYSVEELLQMTVHDLDPDFPAENWAEVWRTLKEKKVLHIESRHVRKDGDEFPIEVEANFVEFEGKEYNAAFVRDISQRVVLQSKQEKLQEKLQSTVLELRQKSAAALA